MKIVTHNVYWFQGAPSRWGVERVAEVPEVLAALTRLYAAEAVDVLCLQEVHRGDLAGSVARDLGMATWLHAPGGGRREYGGAIVCRQAARLGDRTRPDGHVPHERVHLRASLEGGECALELAMVHLPSNRNAGSAEAGDSLRTAELRRVLEEPPHPHLVMGDMNCRPGSTPYRLMEESGYVEAAAAGQAVANRGPDYVWLDRKSAERLVRFAVLDNGDFRRTAPDGSVWRLSDHPPLLVELR